MKSCWTLLLHIHSTPKTWCQTTRQWSCLHCSRLYTTDFFFFLVLLSLYTYLSFAWGWFCTLLNMVWLVPFLDIRRKTESCFFTFGIDSSQGSFISKWQTTQGKVALAKKNRSRELTHQEVWGWTSVTIRSKRSNCIIWTLRLSLHLLALLSSELTSSSVGPLHGGETKATSHSRLIRSRVCGPR